MIKFEQYVNYIENQLSDINGYLNENDTNPDIYNENSEDYNKPHISSKFNFKSYLNSGKYENDYFNQDDIISVYLDDGITRDVDKDTNISLQSIKIEYLVNESKADDFTVLLNEFSKLYRSESIKILNVPMMTEISISHESPEKVIIHGEVRLKYLVNIYFISYSGYILSNEIDFYINDEKIMCNWVSDRATELIPDGRKMVDQKFLQNTSGQVIAITGLFVDSPIINQLIRDSLSASSFAEVYNIKLVYSPINSVLLNKAFYLKEGKITSTFGAVIQYDIQFTSASSVK